MASSPPEKPEPAFHHVIRRLPAGVEYTFIKMIVLDAPWQLTTALWAAEPIADPLWDMFRTKTYRAISRELQRQEKALPPDASPEDRQRLEAVRYELVSELRGTVNLYAARTKRWVESFHVDPLRFAPQFRPPGLRRPYHVIEVWQAAEPGPRLVEEFIIESGPPPWGDTRIAWFDQNQIDRMYCALLEEYFPSLMRLHAGQPWRSRRAPVGWPMITQYVIPRLYDYLKRYYPVRTYTHGRVRPSPGRYPARLREDIADILSLEFPHLANGVKIEWVTAAIQNYLRRAPENRLMGLDLFRVQGHSA